MALVVRLPYGNPRALRISLREYVLASDIGDVTLVPWDVLEAHLVRGPAYPVVGQSTLVAKDIDIWLVFAERISPQRCTRVEAYRVRSLQRVVSHGIRHLAAPVGYD